MKNKGVITKARKHEKRRNKPFQVLPAVLLVMAVGCGEEAPTSDVPVTQAERAQFAEPMSLSCWPERGAWPQFAHDPLHTGRADVELGSADLESAWQFKPSDHVWDYQPGYSVWSSPVIGTVDGHPLVIAGYCDTNVYAIDAGTGEKAWEFKPGRPVFATPALGLIDGRAMVFVTSQNRSIYGLDAAAGTKIWQFETEDWSYTQAACEMASPTLVNMNGAVLLVCGVWNSDRSASRNVQNGEVVVLEAGTGHVKWRKRLGSSPLSSPAVAIRDGVFTLFLTSRHGVMYALDLADGSEHWQAVLNEKSWSSPSVGLEGAFGRVFVGTRLNSLFALDWASGRRVWRQDTGYWIDSTPAWYPAGSTAPEGTIVAAGSYDRHVYAWSGDGSKALWRATIGDYAHSSVAAAKLQGRPVLAVEGWDSALYLIDGLDGEVLWQDRTGPLVWSHTSLGDSLWASPAVAKAGGQILIVFPGLDGSMYGYRPRR